MQWPSTAIAFPYFATLCKSLAASTFSNISVSAQTSELILSPADMYTNLLVTSTASNGGYYVETLTYNPLSPASSIYPFTSAATSSTSTNTEYNDETFYDTNFSANADYVGLGVTIAGVLPFLFILRTIVVWLFRWHEWRRRKRRLPSLVRKRVSKRGDEEAAGFGWKPELSAKQARYEMEAEERRFEMSGEDARAEIAVDSVGRRVARETLRQELRGGEFSQELMGQPIRRQPEVLILT